MWVLACFLSAILKKKEGQCCGCAGEGEGEGEGLGRLEGSSCSCDWEWKKRSSLGWNVEELGL